MYDTYMLDYEWYSDGTAKVIGCELLDKSRLANLKREAVIQVPESIRISEDSYGEEKICQVTAIGKACFSRCFAKSIRLPDTVRIVEDEAFSWIKVDELYLPEQIEKFGKSVFEGARIEQGGLVFPAAMTVVPERTFYQFYAHDGLIIPDSVTKLETYAIRIYKTELQLSQYITEIAPYGLKAQSWLTTLNGTEGNCYEDGVLYNAGETELLAVLEPVTEDFKVPKTVQRIHAYAFAAAAYLEEEQDRIPYRDSEEDALGQPTARIWIPEGVETLEEGTFQNCTWLKSLSLPSTLQRIGKDA